MVEEAFEPGDEQQVDEGQEAAPEEETRPGFSFGTQRLVMLAAGVIVFLAKYMPTVGAEYVFSLLGLLGLLAFLWVVFFIYEIIRITRRWLSPASLAAYVAGAFFIGGPLLTALSRLSVLVYAALDKRIMVKFDVDLFQAMLFQLIRYPENLVVLLEFAALVLLAYMLITYRKPVSEDALEAPDQDALPDEAPDNGEESED